MTRSRKSPSWSHFGIQLRALNDDERALTSDKHGVYVARVEPNSFAADIGMQERDIITSVNRHPVNSIDDVKKIQGTLKPGDPVVFRVVRSNGPVARGTPHGNNHPVHSGHFAPRHTARINTLPLSEPRPAGAVLLHWTLAASSVSSRLVRGPRHRSVGRARFPPDNDDQEEDHRR